MITNAAYPDQHIVDPNVDTVSVYPGDVMAEAIQGDDLPRKPAEGACARGVHRELEIVRRTRLEPVPMSPKLSCIRVASPMNWRRIALLAAIALGATAPAAAQAKDVSQVVTGAIDATNVHMRSTLLSVSPAVSGVSWRVIDLNDEIQLINHSKQP